MQKRILPILFITLVLDLIGFGMIIPIIPIILTDPSSSSFLLHGFSVDAQYIFAGVLTALYGITQFIAAPILGELSDIYGRKKILTLGIVVLACAQILFGIAISIASISLLVFSRIIAGFAGANFSIAQATIADVTAPKDRSKNFGLIGAAFGIGFIIGPVLGGFIASETGSAAIPFFVAGILGIINTLIVTLLLPETRHIKSDVRASFNVTKGVRNIIIALKDVDSRPLFISSFLFQSGFVFFTSFIGILLTSKFGFTEAMIGGFFGIVGIWIVITQGFILRKIAGKISEQKILFYSLLILALGISLYPFVNSIALIYSIIPLIAIGNGLSIANISALISKSVSNERQGAILGISGSVSALSQGIAPLFAGFIGGSLTIKAPFLVGAGLVLGAWYVVQRRRI